MNGLQKPALLIATHLRLWGVGEEFGLEAVVLAGFMGGRMRVEGCVGIRQAHPSENIGQGPCQDKSERGLLSGSGRGLLTRMSASLGSGMVGADVRRLCTGSSLQGRRTPELEPPHVGSYDRPALPLLTGLLLSDDYSTGNQVGDAPCRDGKLVARRIAPVIL